MELRVTAPNRIDLAGGTLDIWPLYAFLGGGYTVNAAITMCSEARIATRSDGKFDIYAEDLEEGETADSLDDLKPGGPMDLIVRVLQVYRPKTGLNIRTRCHAPKGTGLGSSSSLVIALSAGLLALEDKKLEDEKLIDIAANIEAELLAVPTGKQDYWAAARGGVNAIWFGMTGTDVEPLVVNESIREELSERLSLVFTGQTRFSGTSNWNMVKAYIDNVGDTRQNLQVIKRSASEMRDCLLEGDLDAFGTALANEWEARKQLADGVTTPTIDQAMEAASSQGAMASKICGAGGGGCMISFCKPGAKEAVEKALSEAGSRVLPFAIRPEGVLIEQG
jgi:D-glycero-alpha-D-manno-heptose-7-phosphate kinase